MIPGMDGLAMRSQRAWQLPDGGLTAAEIAVFWALVDRESNSPHWRWTGKVIRGTRTSSCHSTATLRGKSVMAARIAWALLHDGLIPERLYRIRTCGDELCINPACHGGKQVAMYAPPAPDPVHDNGISIPRGIEALAAMQFGFPVTPRPIRRLVVHTQEDTFTPPQGPPVVVQAPTHMAPTPRPSDAVLARLLPRDADACLALLFAPGTCLLTFPSGHTWFWNGTVRVDAEDGPTALAQARVLMGQASIKG